MKKYELGIIVGRFQTDYLTSGHLNLLNQVTDACNKVVIFLGVAPITMSTRDPLDFLARKDMISDKYSNVDFYPIHDVSDTTTWSKNLDARIADFITVYNAKNVMLYCGRDGFIQEYNGKFEVTEVVGTVGDIGSATQVRNNIKAMTPEGGLFRTGIIHTKMNQPPCAFCTVDIAPIKVVATSGKKYVLLRQRPDEYRWGFVGGFVDPEKDSDFLSAAKRELYEEASINLSVDDWVKVGDTIVDDWRYRKEKHKIFTTLFVCTYQFGFHIPSDDLLGGKLQWININDLFSYNFVTAHIPLRNMFLEYMKSIEKDSIVPETAAPPLSHESNIPAEQTN